ncbi:Penicillin-Binding Protein C-terminus Family [Paucimonas lemoignei]|nr:Penicillin-Binding Protein C-terminus Family [Paucimonas lemoignei]
MSATVNFTLLRSALLCGLMLSAIPAMADVYTYIDAAGNRVFTDQPHKNAKRVDIPPSNSTTGTPPKRTVKSSPVIPTYKAMFRYQLLRVLVPEPDATVRSTPGDLIVTVTSDPALQPGHSYQLLVDGAPSAAPGRSPVFPLQNVDRGTHQLSVVILDENGRVLERTPNQPFHMQRISLAQKRVANPCQLPEYGVRPECPIKDKPEEKSSFLPFF